MNFPCNAQIQKWFTEFDILMCEKEFLVKRKLEKLKFTNDKQKDRLEN